jgi:methylated-DNA-[protein]-cysteine S-methyltransferase
LTKYTTFSTKYGKGAVVKNDSGVIKVYLPAAGIELLVKKKYPEAVKAVLPEAKALENYFRGVKVDFGDIKADISTMPPFYLRVLECSRTVRYGTKATYGQLALKAGSPKGARAVGNALGANPVPIIVPCHRITAANGLGGYSGGIEWKKRLLKIEGLL